MPTDFDLDIVTSDPFRNGALDQDIPRDFDFAAPSAGQSIELRSDKGEGLAASRHLLGRSFRKRIPICPLSEATATTFSKELINRSGIDGNFDRLA